MEDEPRKMLEVDLRSDTVTKPSKKMYEAMVTAPVGDDVMMEDPTVLALQAKIAKLFNKEDSLFVLTGTMGNLISMMVHCSERGKEIIVGKQSHLFLFEGGGMAQIAGVHVNALNNSEVDGTLDLNEIKENIRDLTDDHMPETKVICLENTQNRRGGLLLPLSYFQAVRKLADENKLLVHLDGSRIFNASVATGVQPSTYADLVDSVSLCFSKGLGAPVGGIVVGSADFCKRARKIRKALGGGLRQAGVLAAAALYGLDNNIEKMKLDHDNAKQFAEVAAEHGGTMAHVDMTKVHTNMAYIKMLKPDIINATQFVERMNKVTEEEERELGQKISVKMLPFGECDVRSVCHLDVSKSDIELASKKLLYVLREINN